MQSLTAQPMVQTVSDGADVELVPGTWSAPKVITDEMLAEHRQWLRAYDAACDVPVPVRDRMRNQFVKRLLSGYSARMSAEDYEVKLRAFEFMLADAPAYCFDDAVLRRTLRHFKKFLPSAGELAEFLEAVQRETREMARRATECCDIAAGKRKFSDAEPVHQRADWTWSRAEAEAHGERLRIRKQRELAELGAIVRQRDAEKRAGGAE
jgi:hypothetical protein